MDLIENIGTDDDPIIIKIVSFLTREYDVGVDTFKSWALYTGPATRG